MPEKLTDAEKTVLLRLARTTLECHLAGASRPAPAELTEALTEPRGAFVTLAVDRTLRGCIGHVVGSCPLWESVRENALAAALHDPRFPPVQADELDGIQIQISALTPLSEIDDVSEIEVGHHGLLIESGHHRGLLLPQVATEYGWDRATFLDHTCRKAGLEPGCWQSPETRIKVFSAEVFGE